MNIKEFIANLKIPTFYIKKIVQPKKSFFTVDSDGDGKADLVQIKVVNTIQPFTLPEKIELGDFDIKEFDPSEYGKLILDGEEVDISKGSANLEKILESFKVYLKKRSYTLEEILGGKAGAITIAMGDSVTIITQLEDKYLEMMTEGKHILTIESEKIPNVEVNFELTKNNLNVKFDPDKF